MVIGIYHYTGSLKGLDFSTPYLYVGILRWPSSDLMLCLMTAILTLVGMFFIYREPPLSFHSVKPFLALDSLVRMENSLIDFASSALRVSKFRISLVQKKSQLIFCLSLDRDDIGQVGLKVAASLRMTLSF